MRRKCLMMPKAYVNMDSEESDSKGGNPGGGNPRYIVLKNPYLTGSTQTGGVIEHYSISEEIEGVLVNTR